MVHCESGGVVVGGGKTSKQSTERADTKWRHSKETSKQTQNHVLIKHVKEQVRRPQVYGGTAKLISRCVPPSRLCCVVIRRQVDPSITLALALRRGFTSRSKPSDSAALFRVSEAQPHTLCLRQHVCISSWLTALFFCFLLQVRHFSPCVFITGKIKSLIRILKAFVTTQLQMYSFFFSRFHPSPSVILRLLMFVRLIYFSLTPAKPLIFPDLCCCRGTLAGVRLCSSLDDVSFLDDARIDLSTFFFHALVWKWYWSANRI